MTLFKRIFGKKQKPQSRMPRSPRAHYSGSDIEEVVDGLVDVAVAASYIAHDPAPEPYRAPDPTPSHDYGSSHSDHGSSSYGSSSHDSGGYDSGSSDSGSCGGCD